MLSIATNFSYDGILLSDYGYIICDFDNSDLNKVSNGSQINFKTTPIMNGKKYLSTGISYDECLEATFQICKNPCLTSHKISPIPSSESREIMRWLNREEFCKLRMVDDPDLANIYFEGSFNVNKIELNGAIYGFELNFVSNRPFGLHDPITYKFNVGEDGSKTYIDDSDIIGYNYVNMIVTCQADGDLIIHNSLENRDTVVKNCRSGEILTMNYPVTIQSSLSSHKIQNDFNYNYPRMANTFRNRKNTFTFSLPCNVKMTYTPNRKVSI